MLQLESHESLGVLLYLDYTRAKKTIGKLGALKGILMIPHGDCHQHAQDLPIHKSTQLCDYFVLEHGHKPWHPDPANF